ncbi:unnamed protein product [Dibothriocephalus latus]|uniref:Uncharacterized protein n=1 Tax=Dibothriocephalus latus TaxID=60516 RepID=A0A3P7P7G7_DIBLA|nr:unnamed protein product [Dibothriocephalus latus]
MMSAENARVVPMLIASVVVVNVSRATRVTLTVSVVAQIFANVLPVLKTLSVMRDYVNAYLATPVTDLASAWRLQLIQVSN